MITMVGKMIEELQEVQRLHGSSMELAIRDADTQSHMKIKQVRKSNNVERILIVGAGYGEGLL